MKEIKKGDVVFTPRFLNVQIEEVYASEAEARQAGFKETTHYWDDPEYGINGKSLDINRMCFAAFRKGE